MTLIRIAAAAALTSVLGGCAHLPDVTVGYYLAQSNLRFKVLRTVVCDASNNLIVVNAATPAVTHSADRDQFVSLPLARLKGAFSDTDLKFDFFEDGRLKNINAATTGEGEDILKSAVTVAAALAAGPGIRRGFPTECAFIKSVNGGKPISLAYEGDVDTGKGPRVRQAIPADPASASYAEKLASAIGGVCATVAETEVSKAPLTHAANSTDVLLRARQPGLARIVVSAGAANDCASDMIWEGKLRIAQLGTAYSIPIPPAATFGKQVFAASFQESGALTSVQYASGTGAGQVFNAANTALGALAGESTARQAAQVKAEADLIVQQQRLAQCVADPASCR